MADVNAETALVVNRAVDEVLALIEPDEATQDTVNLLVNVIVTRIESGEDDDIADIVEACYGEPLETVVAWCRGEAEAED